MASDLQISIAQTSANQLATIPQINAILANYALTLPAHDPVTGLISPANVTTLLNAINPNPANDINGRRTADSATISHLLQFAGLSGTALTSSPTTLSGTSGTLNSTNQIINPSGTFTLTLPAPSTMPGQSISLKSTAAQIVNSA